MKPVTAKYLAHHACPEAALASAWAANHPAIHGSVCSVCVIPAFDESVELLAGLAGAAASAGPRPLFIVVVNATDAALPASHASNAQLIGDLRGRARAVEVISAAPPIWLLSQVGGAGHRDLDILLIDRASPGVRLPPGQGVGLARRIGCDVALALRQSGAVTARFIHTTDADVILPGDYFAASQDQRSAALTYPFWHEAARNPALALYEISLRYYVLGLAWAGSPYAHHTVGSTLAVDADAYAACRGIPGRQAGEDFYLVNKLVKLGPVTRPRLSPIRIRARLSERVPFGTGPATRRIAAQLASGRDFRMYHPRSFAALASWLDTLDRFARAPSPASDPRALAREVATGALARDEILSLITALERMAAFDALDDARGRTRSPAALKKRLHDWFDGFRTLKLLHSLRDAGFADLPWQEALRAAPFCRGMEPSSNLEDLRRALLAREERRDVRDRSHGDVAP